MTQAQSDYIYENQVQDPDEIAYYPESTFVDMVFSLVDFLLQVNMLLILVMSILTKEGFIDTLSPYQPFHSTLKNYGLTKNVNIITLFMMAHLNKSRYIGISTLDSFQYLMIRALPVLVQLLLIWRSEYSGTLKFHFEQLVVTIIYTAYLVFSDWQNSRQN